MKKWIDIKIDAASAAGRISCGFMITSALIRLCYYLSDKISPSVFWIHLFLPVMAAILFVTGFFTGKVCQKPLFIGAVVLGILFFIVKAFSFSPLHQILCTMLYLTVLILYTLTVLGFLPTKKLLYPLFGLPLVYHIFVEDTQLYFFADPPVPVWDWLPEISVLCIMAALLTQAVAMRTVRNPG